MSPPGFEVEYVPDGEMVVDLTVYAHRPTRITGFEYVPGDLEFPALYEEVSIQMAVGDATETELVFDPFRPFSLRPDTSMTIRTTLRFANCVDRPVGMGVATNPVVVVEGVGRQILPMPDTVAVLSPPDDLCPERG